MNHKSSLESVAIEQMNKNRWIAHIDSMETIEIKKCPEIHISNYVDK